MTILKSQLYGGSLVGVYLTANNSFVLYPNNLLDMYLEKFKSVFEVPLYPITFNNSNLLGVYSAGNKFGIIVPHLIREDELDALKAITDNGAQIGVLKSIDNAFGNLILCNDKGAIISSLLKKEKNQIQDVLNVETVVFEFASSYLPGSISIANNHGCLVHPLSSDDEIDLIASVLKVETDVSTVNRGIPYISSGAVVNDESGIFGLDSTGPEMQRMSNVLNL
jgi:translation initiation factor 6